jgi:hypothetical protein
VTYGSGLFVAVGVNRAILTSSDGAAWAEQKSGFSGLLTDVGPAVAGNSWL